MTEDLADQFKFTVFVPDGESALVGTSYSTPGSIVRYPSGAAERFLQQVRNVPMAYRALDRVGLARSRLEVLLSRSEVDLAYFMSPNPLAAGISDIPIVTTIWDLAHVNDPEFPEVTSRRRNEYRDSIYGRAARKSVAVIVDSDQGAKQVSHSYGIDPSRVVAVPFWSLVQPWGFPAEQPRDHVIYPAQFWPHKNHAVLLRAAHRLVSSGRPVPLLVFAGGDRGNRAYIENLARDLGVAHCVDFAGFVPEAELKSLLLRSRGLVMPTYFGPTNLPPVEALLSGIPVAVSTCDALAQHADGEAIQAIPPGDVDGWASALERFALLRVPRPVCAPTELASTEPASQILQRVFAAFAERRSTWAPGRCGWE